MHPRFREMLALLRSRNVKLTMTSNGLSVAALDDDELRAFHDLEFSLDYPTREEQDAQRGRAAGIWCTRKRERCRRLGVPVTIVAVMMRTNFRRLAEIAGIAGRYGAPLRVNVCQSVRTVAFAPTYEQYWEAFELLLSQTDVLAVGEPLVRAMLGLPRGEGGCGAGTVRVTPRATVQPCVYWPGPGDPLRLLLEVGANVVATPAFRAARSLPPACEPCELREACGGDAPAAGSSTGRSIDPIGIAPSCAANGDGCQCASRRAAICPRPAAPAPRSSWRARRRRNRRDALNSATIERSVPR